MRKQELFPVAAPKKQEIPNVQKQEAFFGAGDFNVEHNYGKVTDAESKIAIGKIIDEIWLNKLGLGEKADRLVGFIYHDFEKYENLLLERLNFNDEKAYAETVKTLAFIKEFVCQYDFEYPSREEFDSKTSKIKEILDEAVANERGSYFLNLFARGVKELIEQWKPYLEAEEIFNRKYQARMEAKYGSDWENYLEDEDRLEQIELAREHYLEESHIPFVIAPNIYAVRAESGFLVSQKKDFGEIKELIDELENLPKSNWEIEEMEGVGYYDHYIDENQEIGNLHNEKIDRKVADLSEKIHSYFLKKLTLENLEINNNDQNQESKERNTQNFHDYMYLQEPFFRELIKKSLDVNLANISIKEQFYLLQFIKKTKEKDIDPIKKFAQTYKTSGLKAFLSLELDENNGDRIISIGKKLSKENASLVFEKIAQLIDLVEQENAELAKIIFKDSEKDLPDNLHAELLRKAHQIILKFSTELEIGGLASEEKIQQLLSDLENSKIGIDFLAAALRSFKISGEKVDLETIRELDFSVKDFGQEFSDEEKEEMRVIAEINWRQNPNMKDVVVGSFAKSLEDANQKFYVLKYQGKVVSFVRFEKTDQGKLYAGSFNVYPDARSTGIGEEMMNRALKKEAQENILEATVSPRIPAGTAYVERVGFVVDGIIANYHETGEPLFNIELDNAKNLGYRYRNEGKELSISEEEIKAQVESSENLEDIIGKDVIVFKFDMLADFERMKETMGKMLIAKDDNGKNIKEGEENKYIITRYFKESKEKENVRYFVLERISQKSNVSLTKSL